MKFDFDIPKELAHLKLDERGYPIPYFAPIVDGKPNFRMQDERKRDECIRRHLCPICGRKLYKDYSYMISGPMGLKNCISSDAMMHRVCAEFAMRVCPHLYYHKAERKGHEKALPNKSILEDKPDVLYLVKASKFKGKYNEIAKSQLVHFTPASVEKYVYRNNVLVKESDL
jgi:hypothetical protein